MGFAESLFDNDDTVEDVVELNVEEDKVANAFTMFKTKKEPEEVKPVEKEDKAEVETPTEEKKEEKMEQEAEQSPKESTKSHGPTKTRRSPNHRGQSARSENRRDQSTRS